MILNNMNHFIASSNNPSPPAIPYRADIDGLRAIAILLVLFYHGGLSLFPSGFVGVDIFFVISGFLITNLIQQSLDSQRFSFRDFYNRRLWRLQPVLISMLIFTALAALLCFLPEDLLQFNHSARKTTLFLSNVFFNHTTTGYFAPDTHQLPLLHTWSLSIEWQCYLILPIMIYGLYRLCPKQMRFIIYFLTLIAFLLSWYASNQMPLQTYYQFSSRLFEFLIGACLPFFPITHKNTGHHLKMIAIHIVALSALILIGYIAYQDHILVGYPNYYALFICLATGFLIALGQYYPRNFISRLLSYKPVVFIGILSYSLYIWHWPLFAILRYQNIPMTPTVLLTAYAFTGLLAYASWRYIEKPARQFHRLKFQQSFLILLLLPALLIHSSAYLIKKQNGFPKRFNQELVYIYQKLERYTYPQRPLCISNSSSSSSRALCYLGADAHSTAGTKTGLLIGDSFSNHYWGFMNVLGKAAHVSFFAQATSSCLTLPGIYLYDWWYYKQRIYQECYEQTQRYYNLIQKNHYDYVIIGQAWGNYLTPSIINDIGDERSLELAKQRITQALEKALRSIIASGARPVLIQTTAVMKEQTKDCFFRHIKLRQTYHPEQCHFPLMLSWTEQWFSELFQQMQQKYPQLIIIDPKRVQCPKQLCTADINGVPVYRDVGHITDYASYQLGKRYLRKFANPFLSSVSHDIT